MLILQLLGQPVLQSSWYVSYLLPTAFLAVGSQLATPLSRLDKSKYTLIAATTITLLVGLYLAYYHTPLYLSIGLTSSIWYALAFLVAGALCLIIVARDRKFINTLLVSLAFLFFTSTNVTLLNSACPNCDSGLRKQNFLAVMKSDTFIRTYDADGELKFWYSATEPLGQLYISIVCTHLDGDSLINDNFPETNVPAISIYPGTYIVILSSDKDALAKANTALSTIRLKASLLGTEEITQGPITFTMTFIRTEYSKRKP